MMMDRNGPTRQGTASERIFRSREPLDVGEPVFRLLERQAGPRAEHLQEDSLENTLPLRGTHLSQVILRADDPRGENEPVGEFRPPAPKPAQDLDPDNATRETVVGNPRVVQVGAERDGPVGGPFVGVLQDLHFPRFLPYIDHHVVEAFFQGIEEPAGDAKTPVSLPRPELLAVMVGDGILVPVVEVEVLPQLFPGYASTERPGQGDHA